MEETLDCDVAARRSTFTQSVRTSPAYIVDEMDVRTTPEDWFDICRSKFCRELVEKVNRLSAATGPVMIVGECGTGRHLIAHRIHQLSSGCSRVIGIPCGKLHHILQSAPHSALCESVLPFLEASDSSSELKSGLLLQQLDETSPLGQLLVTTLMEEMERRLQLARFPLVVSTTDPAIDAAVKSGGFRKDLFYRLNVLELVVPPLRDHPEDVALLAEHFLEELSPQRDRSLTLTDQAMNLLSGHHWPGNILELRNTIAKVIVLADGPKVGAEELLRLWQPARRGFNELRGLNLEEAETQLILDAIAQCDGNKSMAARQLGITTRTLHNKIQKYRRLGLVE